MFRYVSLFSGIGGFEHAFNAAGGKMVAHAEIDKFAIQSYNSFFGEGLNLGDISKVDTSDIPEHDILTGGFPCQAFSVAGKRAGMAFKCDSCGFTDTISFNQYADRDFTCYDCFGDMSAVDGRGLMFFEIARVARDKQPAVVIMENVKGLVGFDKGRTLDTIVRTMSAIGYVIDFEVLNSKFFGVPQNRERIFIVAVRKDLHPCEPWTEESLKGHTVIPKGKRRIAAYPEVLTFNFPFPKNDTVEKILADVLEKEVDEKYYLDDIKTAGLIEELEESDKVSEALLMDCEIPQEPKMLGLLNMKGNESIRRVYDPNACGPTLTTMGGGHREPKVAIEEGIVKEDLKIPVKVRKHDVDIHGLQKILRKYKRQSDKTFKQIAEEINQPITKVEHWFRTDSSFSIPEPDTWFKLKEVIGVSTGEFDKQVTEFVKKPGEFEKGNRVYYTHGQSPTLTSASAAEKVFDKQHRIRKLTPRECWRLQGFPEEAFEAAVAAGVSNTQLYKQAGNAVTVPVIDHLISSLKEFMEKEGYL